MLIGRVHEQGAVQNSDQLLRCSHSAVTTQVLGQRWWADYVPWFFDGLGSGPLCETFAVGFFCKCRNNDPKINGRMHRCTSYMKHWSNHAQVNRVHWWSCTTSRWCKSDWCLANGNQIGSALRRGETKWSTVFPNISYTILLHVSVSWNWALCEFFWIDAVTQLRSSHPKTLWRTLSPWPQVFEHLWHAGWESLDRRRHSQFLHWATKIKSAFWFVSSLFRF